MPDYCTIAVDGHTMAYYAYNEDKSGLPIIFIHGLTDSIDFWEDLQTPAIKDHWRWYSLSLPGHHPAFCPADSPFTAEHLASITYQTIQQLIGDEPFVIAGVSTGGFMALNVASHYPENVRGVLCISGFVGGYWRGIGWLGQKIAQLGRPGQWLLTRILQFSMLSRRVFRYVNLATVYQRNAVQTTVPHLNSVIDKQYAHFRQSHPDDLYQYFQFIHNVNLTPQLHHIQAPTLVIWCENDPFIPRQQAHLIREYIPHSQLVVLPETGHFPMWENLVYHKIVTEWLEKDV